MRLKNLDLIAAVTIAAMNLIWVLLPYHIIVIGIILALPLVFIVPGYTLTEALLCRRSLDASKRLVFSIALSLAIDILSGFILNLLLVGLQAKSWAVLLGLLTALFSLLAVYLRRGVSDNGARGWRLGLSIYVGILFVLAIVIIIQSLLYSIIGAAQQPRAGFTQLWLLPPVQTGKSCALRLGVRSFELTSTTYRITATMNRAQTAAWPSVVLAHEQEWDQLIPITAGASGTVSIEVRLYRSDKPDSVYQEVNSTFAVRTGHDCPNPGTSSTSLKDILVQRLPVVIQQSPVDPQKGEVRC